MCLCPMFSQAFDHGIHKCNEHVVEEIAEKSKYTAVVITLLEVLSHTWALDECVPNSRSRNGGRLIQNI
jgi:hypothetical protein